MVQDEKKNNIIIIIELIRLIMDTVTVVKSLALD